MYLRILLQENEAAIKLQEGKIFNLHQDFLSWAGVDFPLHDDDKKEDKDEEEEEEEDEKEEEEEENEEKE